MVTIINKEYDFFLEDAIALFSGEKHGHMEKWEYAKERFPGDKAAGGRYWEKLIAAPGKYYLFEEEVRNIEAALSSEVLLSKINDVGAVTELGPGCSKALSQKTLPLLGKVNSINQYRSIDSSEEFAKAAAEHIAIQKRISTAFTSIDYFTSPVEKTSNDKTAYLMWGSSIGNLPNRPGKSPLKILLQLLQTFSMSLRVDDVLILSFDTETDPKKVLSAYSENNLSNQILSPVFRLQEYVLPYDDFDPEAWSHKPEWIKTSQQCCHVIYPEIDQRFTLKGKQFSIRAGEKFVSNNSYKYRPEDMLAIAKKVGLSRSEAFSDNHRSMALLIGQK